MASLSQINMGVIEINYAKQKNIGYWGHRVYQYSILCRHLLDEGHAVPRGYLYIPDTNELKINLKQLVILDGRIMYDPKQMSEVGFDYFSMERGKGFAG